MKKLIFLATAFMIVLSGCTKDTSPRSSGNGEQVQEPLQQQQPKREAVFKNEDIDQAKKMAQRYVAILTEFHGRRVRTTADFDNLQAEMSRKIKAAIPIYEDSRISPATDTQRNDQDILELSASRFQLFLDNAQEIYYPILKVSELTIPMTYKVSESHKYAIHKSFKYTLHFVKTTDNQVQFIRDGFFVGGDNLEQKEGEYTPYEAQKVKRDLHIQ